MRMRLRLVGVQVTGEAGPEMAAGVHVTLAMGVGICAAVQERDVFG